MFKVPGTYYDMVRIRLSDRLESAYVSGIEATIDFYTARFTLMDTPEGIQSKISWLIENLWTESWFERQAQSGGKDAS
jgi:hypothetical protein